MVFHGKFFWGAMICAREAGRFSYPPVVISAPARPKGDSVESIPLWDSVESIPL